MEKYFELMLNNQLTLDDLQSKSKEERRKVCCWILEQLGFEIDKRSDLSYFGPLPEQNCNSSVSMAYDNDHKSLVVVKKTMHKDGKYVLPLNTLFELATYFRLTKIKSNNLPILYNIHISEICTDIITEYIPLSFYDLFFNQLPPDFIELKINELIKTVKLLHENDIAHRDIKTSNIRFDSKSCVVLIDFDSSSNCQRRSTVPIVTLNYRAPELIRNQYSNTAYTKKEYDAFACDWWSIGCVLGEMFLGSTIFTATVETPAREVLQQIETFLIKLHNDQAEPFKRRMPKNLYDLFKCLLTEDPAKRVQNLHTWEHSPKS